MRELDRAGDADLGEARRCPRGRGTGRARSGGEGRAAPRSPGSPRRRPGHRGSPGHRSRGPRRASRRCAAPRTMSSSSSRLVIRTPDPSSIERGPGSERSVHEGLQVAEAQEVVARCGSAAAASASSGMQSAGSDCQTRSDEPFALVDAAEDRRGAEPSVLVVNRPDPARVGDTDAVARRRRPIRRRSPSTKRSRNRQADSSRRTPVGSAVSVSLDDAARHLEVAARPREAGRVQPERVVVLRPESGRRRRP